MNLFSLITGPARLGLTIGGRVAGLIRSRIAGSPQIDDGTLERQVEADVFASRGVPRAKVQVEVAEGVVWLRGEVKSSAIADEAEARAGAIAGVVRVENLIRVAKAQPERTQKRPTPKRSSRPKPAAAAAPPPDVRPAPAATPPPAAQQEREVTRRFNAEETSEAASELSEPTPRELAESGEGRRPAPLGATSPTEGGSPPAPFPTVANGTGDGERSG